MARAYSEDLRDRVIDAVTIEGMSCRGAAERFDISESSAIRWVRRYRQLGERGPVGTGGHRPSKLQPHRMWLLHVIEEEPDITLAALSEKFLAEKNVKATTGMLSYFFISEGISFKKKHFTQRTGQSRRCTPPEAMEEIPRPD
jgi:transposase